MSIWKWATVHKNSLQSQNFTFVTSLVLVWRFTVSVCLCVCVFVHHTPSILSAQPHGALVGLRVDAEQVLQARPGERAPGGPTHSAAVHGALCMGAARSADPQHPWSSVGACHWELLLLLTAGGLCSHVLGAWTLVIFDGVMRESISIPCVCVCKYVCDRSMSIFTHCRSWMIWWSDWPDSAEWMKGWVNPHHQCHHCQREQAPPLVLETTNWSVDNIRIRLDYTKPYNV